MMDADENDADDASASIDESSNYANNNNHVLSWVDPFPTPCSSFGTHASPTRCEVNVFSPEFYRRDRSVDDEDDVAATGGQYDTPIRSRPENGGSEHSDDNGRQWDDPFPTPEATAQPFVTPHRHRTVEEAYDDYQTWLQNHLPPLPCMDSLDNRDGNDKSSQHNNSRSRQLLRRRSIIGLTPISKSESELNDAMDPPSIRRISSENRLMSRIPSLDDIIQLSAAAAAVGPDGNDLVLKKKCHQETKKNTNVASKIQDGSSSWNQMKLTTMKRNNPLQKRQSKDDLLLVGHQPIYSSEHHDSVSPSPAIMNRQHSKDDLDLLPSNNNNNTNLNNQTPNNNNHTFPKTRLTPLLTPVRKLLKANSIKLRQKLQQRREKRRLRREARQKHRPTSWWILIPADHPYKIIWDVLTMLWAFLGAYRTHIRIRDRVFDQSPLILLTEIWFTLDIVLNFVTEHKTSKGQVIRDGKTVWARYLTSWFVVDLLSLIPWERIYVRPIVEKMKKRNIFQKTFFRSKAVVRVSRVLRGRHVKLIGRVSKQTGTPLCRIIV